MFEVKKATIAHISNTHITQPSFSQLQKYKLKRGGTHFGIENKQLINNVYVSCTLSQCKTVDLDWFWFLNMF